MKSKDQDLNKETREERMARLREEQRLMYQGKPVRRKRIVGKPSRRSKRKAAKYRGQDAFFRSNQGGAPQ